MIILKWCDARAWVACLTVVATLWASAAALAEDRALLVGVGKYRLPGNDLPGIGTDIEIMKEVATRLGYEAQQIRVMLDHEATLANVERALSTWTVNGVSSSDRVLIYFSSHGTRIPDENGDEVQDRADEALTMHDVAPDRRRGRRTLKGVLVDDRLGQLLARIPSRNVIVFIDACHSGTATRELPLRTRSLGLSDAVVKFYTYPDMPPETRGVFIPRSLGTPSNYVALAAAGDDEKSLATTNGSVFTLGLQLVIAEAGRQGLKLTPAALRDALVQFVAAEVPADKRFRPRLTGASERFQEPIPLAGRGEAVAYQWERMVETVGRGTPLTVGLNQTSFRSGERLVVTVDVPGEGYLNIVNVNAQDQATVLFPNRYNENNRVTRGAVSVPTSNMPFDLVAQAPYGRSLVAAFLTEQPINLFRSGHGNRNDAGEIVEVFASLSTAGFRSFAVAGKQQQRGLRAGMVETQVCQGVCR